MKKRPGLAHLKKVSKHKDSTTFGLTPVPSPYTPQRQ